MLAFTDDQRTSNVVDMPTKPKDIQEQRDRLAAAHGDKSEEAKRPYRPSMTMHRDVLKQRFQLGIYSPGAYCQLAFEMDEIGKAGPEVFDTEDFIDRWKVETGVSYNKKTKADEVKFKRLNAAVVNRELLRLESSTKTSIVQTLMIEVDYGQGYDQEGKED
jgi:hypothetical protein